jgi:hypothetical protein
VFLLVGYMINISIDIFIIYPTSKNTLKSGVFPFSAHFHRIFPQNNEAKRDIIERIFIFSAHIQNISRSFGVRSIFDNSRSSQNDGEIWYKCTVFIYPYDF